MNAHFTVGNQAGKGTGSISRTATPAVLRPGSRAGFGPLMMSSVLALGGLLVGSAEPVMARDARYTPLTTVASVDPVQYMGLWYDIAHNPAQFQDGCYGTTAEYSLKSDGTVKVVNTCYLGALDGEINTITGSAKIVDTTTNAKLSVSFAPTAGVTRDAGDSRLVNEGARYLQGNYWIIGLDEDYSYAVVGEPSRKYLWFLARTPTISDSTLQELLTIAVTKGYDPSKLEYTVQQ